MCFRFVLLMFPNIRRFLEVINWCVLIVVIVILTYKKG
jgi:hypothetical protein